MKSKIYLTLALTISIAAHNGDTAMFSKEEAGTSSAQFLKIGPGARPVAMGEAFAGLSDDINAMYWNPAGLHKIYSREFSAVRAQWVEGISFNWLGYAQDLLGGKMGLSLVYLGSGDIQRYDNAGNAGSEAYNTFDAALSVSYAREIKKIPLGINVKYIHSKLEDETAQAFAADVGVLKDIPVSDKKSISVGLAVQNIGTGLRYVKESSPLPLNVKAGAAYKLLGDKLVLTSDVNFPVDYDASAHIGAEYRHRLGGFDVLPRLGYKTTNIRYMNVLSGASLGFGVMFASMSVNYAWVPYWEFGTTHRIDVGLKFGQKKSTTKPDYSDNSMQYACVDCVNIAARNIHFDFGNYTVKEMEVPVLDTIAALLVKYNPYRIRVSGHSDSVEDKSFGKDLSFKRANFIIQYLVQKGVPFEKISAIAYGSDLPLKDNSNEAGRGANRRVEFFITDNEGQKELAFHPYASIKEIKELENIHLTFGRSLFAENKYDTATEEFNKALKINPQNEEAREYIEKIEDAKTGKTGIPADRIDRKIKRMRRFFKKGQEFFKQGKYKESIKQFEKVLSIDPMHIKSMAYIVRARGMMHK